MIRTVLKRMVEGKRYKGTPRLRDLLLEATNCTLLAEPTVVNLLSIDYYL